jgi:coiled-coil domain-containing protein 61
MAKKEEVSERWRFGQVDYSVSMTVDGSTLTVEVEDSHSADVWKAVFDPKQLEELTRKTGNYKQFSVFISMLRAAITRSSDSVSLDLLTYADLEVLRSQKYGGSTHRGMSPGPKSAQSQLHSKRYLILTYSAEFDRIHYPLSLPYAGKTDPTKLQETIRKLQAEVAALQKTQTRGHLKSSDVLRLQQDYDLILQEKEELEELFEAFKNEVTLSRDGTAAKQIKILKQAVRNLEAELAKEKSKYQRLAQKKTQEIRELMEELDELRSSERNLRIRLKSVSNELAVYKQGQIYSQQSRSTTKNGVGRAVRQRTNSAERQFKRQAHPNPSKYRMKTPSPSGGRFPRFDPTAYIQDKLRKQQDSNLRLGRGKLVSSSSRLRSRSNSLEKGRSSTQRPPRPSPSNRLYTGYTQGQRSRTSSVGSNASSKASTRSSSRQSSLTRSDSENSITQLRSGKVQGRAL